MTHEKDGVRRGRSEAGRAPVGHGELYYEECGEGPPLILIHGNGLDVRMWKEQLGHFSADFRTVAYDMRGFGRSSALTSAGYSTAADLAALCDYLEIESAHVIGHSRGGPIAIAYALEFPDRASSLTLVDAGIFGLPFSPEYQAIYDAVLEKAGEGDIEAAKSAWIGSDLFAPARKNAGVEAALREMLGDYQPFLWRHPDPDTWARVDQVERLREIAIPCLVVIGSLDLRYFQDAAALLSERIPRARKRTIEGVGHMTPMEAPEEFNAIVDDFLRAP